MSSQIGAPLRTLSSHESDPYATADVYYGPGTHNDRKHARARTYSATHSQDNASRLAKLTLKTPTRRSSHDERSKSKNERLSLKVEETIQGLVNSKDAGKNYQITRDDAGPKTIFLGTSGSNGLRQFELRGTYVLSNLMQELFLARMHGRTHIDIDVARLYEHPTERLHRLIKKEFWVGLTRQLDGKLIDIAGRDPKDWTNDPRPRIYIPVGAPEQHAYYTKVALERPEIRLDVCWLPKDITPDAVYAMNAKPGLLAIAMEEVRDETTGAVTDLKGLPFVVPGGRFNELYGWDSYMEALGLIECKRVDLAKSMVQHFIFCIKHYGKILNANRSYYLTRSQPPFLTDMAMRVYKEIKSNDPGALEFLRNAILAAIKEYHTVWMAAPRLDKATGLSRYRPEGKGVPPETESTHFTHLLEPYAKKNNLSFDDFVKAYNNGEVQEPELDEYFLHDRAVRESGHDTSYRLEGVCANLATIDLNALLYKYETDIAECIRTYFKDSLQIPAEFCVGDKMEPGHSESSSLWERRARLRKQRIDKYLWNERKGMYFDYDTVQKKQCTYETATTFWALWAGVAEPEQAIRLVSTAVPLFEMEGGLVSGTEKSRGRIGLDRPNRQWDYPFGWAPQQILAWEGLMRYGQKRVCQRLAYRWTRMMISAFVDFHGVVVEKYDVTKHIAPHKVEAEYGNQGLDFQGVAREGFGWVNSSYILGYKHLDVHMRRAIDHQISWEDFIKTPHNVLEEASDEDAISEEADE